MRLLRVAIQFYSRIPVGKIQNYQESDLNNATTWLPMVGLIVGLALVVLVWLSLHIFSLDVSLVLMLVVSLLLTGAFHEDGFADSWDGIGGGWTPEQKLSIMKDSRLGTYGGASLILLLLLKYQLWLEVDVAELLFTLVIVQVLSRFSPLLMIRFMTYVRLDDTSKVKPVAQGISNRNLWLIFVQWLALVGIMFFLLDIKIIIQVHLVMLVALLAWTLFLQRQLGGYTGDGLGGAQQVSELAILMAFVAS